METKRCSKCKVKKGVGEFGKNRTKKGGLQSYCKECWSEYQKKRREANPEALSEIDKRRNFKKFGLTLQSYEALLEKQGGGCRYCGRTEPGGRGRFHVDHDHNCCPGDKSCGKCIRGLACYSCNTGFGKLGDSSIEIIPRLTKFMAAEYEVQERLAKEAS